MKRLISLLCVAAMACVAANAQKITEGSLAVLKNQDRVNLVVDYSSATIHGMNEAAFSEYEKDWYKDKPEIISDVRQGFSEKCKNFVLASDVKDIPTIRIVVLSIERKGDTACSAEILDKNGNVVCKISKIFGEGGTFGTKLNLIKDGASEVGEKFGKYMAKQLKKLK